MPYLRKKSLLKKKKSLNTIKFDADVLIVGGGPSGAICAYYLAKSGKKVTLIDAQKFPRDKICGDFVTPASLKELMNIGISHLDEFKATNIVTVATIHLDGEPLITENIPQIEDFVNYGRVIPRVLLDNWILDAAKQQGVEVITDCKLLNYVVQDEYVTVDCNHMDKNRSFVVKNLVGADGSNSTVARILQGKKTNPSHKLIAVRAYFENVNCVDKHAELFFSRKSFPGYYWFFPTSSTTANVGIGMVLETFPKPEINLKTLLFDMIEEDASFKAKIGQGAHITKIVGWPLSCYDPNAIISKDRVLLTGDAAGFINMLNGEGIQYALQSGRLAAETLIECFESDDFTAASLKRFDTKVSKGFGLDLSFVNIVVHLIRNRNLNFLWLTFVRVILYQAQKDEKYASLSAGIFVGLIPLYKLLSISFINKTILRCITCFLNIENKKNIIFKQAPPFIYKKIQQSLKQKMAYWIWIRGIIKTVSIFMRLSVKFALLKLRMFLKPNS